jgi:hypothetical protein
MVALFAVGAWLPLHVLPRLRGSLARTTGIVQLVLLAVLVATGFGLYYVASENSRPAWSTTHWLAGLALAVSLIVHRRRNGGGSARAKFTSPPAVDAASERGEAII